MAKVQSLCNDPDFILKAMNINSISVLHSSVELKKNKEFALKAADFVKNTVWKQAFLEALDP
jgi:hypothetical protein